MKNNGKNHREKTAAEMAYEHLEPEATSTILKIAQSGNISEQDPAWAIVVAAIDAVKASNNAADAATAAEQAVREAYNIVTKLPKASLEAAINSGAVLKHQISESGEILTNDICRRVTKSIKEAENSFLLSLHHEIKSTLSKFSDVTETLRKLYESANNAQLKLITEWERAFRILCQPERLNIQDVI